MSVAFGRNIKVDIYGASHADRIGVKIDGLPAGLPVDMKKLQAFLDRRAPGRNAWSTPRKEADAPEIISGLKEGVTDGSTLEAVIYNTNIRPDDYGNVITVPRPGHADYTSWVKQGKIETGGGRWSGRMTAPLCIAGGICMQFMEAKGIKIAAHVCEIGGGQIECVISGMPAGVGDALFGGMESRISQAVFAVPAVKGIEFGRTEMFGSENNDSFCIREGRVETVTNNHGGILGGISSGMPLVFRVRIKPTPSIGREQESVDLERMEPAVLAVRGRHDPCIVPRAVPCIEAAAAIAVYDMLLGD